ncbi:hypothetical protein NQ315_014012 [Exocentrus adspersus]|uniref:HAT C-terminal dimerisation domain-containing protein n=1 Tax=Exocentrus adspersus TaxID=1586481 RepID=A0AAV8V6D9_9CUCU|nr:hypothetical protein NQ315_014012 [Exocentrus adspersus]
MKSFDGQFAFRNVARLAKLVLSLPHSNAECERIFSMVTDVKCKKRNRLESIRMQDGRNIGNTSVQNIIRVPGVTGLTALCIVLRRLSYPNRLNDLILMFGLSPQSLSQIIKTTLNIIVAERGERLDNLTRLAWLNERRMRYYAQAVTAKGGAIPTCWG